MADRLATMAQAHYQQFLPQAYAAIPAAERTAFFDDLAGQMNERIAELEDALAPPPTDGEPFQEALGRMTEARAAAEAQTVREMLPDPEASAMEAAMTPDQEEQGSLDPEPVDPDEAGLADAVAAFWAAQQETDDPETATTP